MIVHEDIFSKNSQEPINCGEYLHLLKPEYTIISGYEEEEHYSDSATPAHYYVRVIHVREETDEEKQARIKANRDRMESDMFSTMRRSKVGDFFFYKLFENKKMTSVRMLRLLEWNEEAKQARFQMDNANSNEFLTTTVSKMVGFEWVVNPGEVRKTVISKYGI